MKESKLLRTIDNINITNNTQEVFGRIKRIIGYVLKFSLIFAVCLLISFMGKVTILAPFLFAYIVILNISRCVIKRIWNRTENILEGYGKNLGLKLGAILFCIEMIGVFWFYYYFMTNGRLIGSVILTIVTSVINFIAYNIYWLDVIKEINVLAYIMVNIVVVVINQVFILLPGFIETLAYLITVFILIAIVAVFTGTPNYVVNFSKGGNIATVRKIR